MMKKGLKILIAGIVLFVIAAFIFPFSFLFHLLKMDREQDQFQIPGTHRVELSEAGKYVLWNHTQTIFEGKTYHRPGALPDGLQITVTDSQNRLLPLTPDSSTSSSSGDSVTKRSVATFTITEPTSVEVKVSGDSEAYIFSVAKSQLEFFLFSFFGVAILSIIFSALSFGLVIWGVVKMLKKEKATPPALPNI